MAAVLLSTAYFPPISYMAALAGADTVHLEAHEHFVKQTYRNRTSIYGANGQLDLVIPVRHKDLYAIPINRVQIADDTSWKKIHWRSIESAYRNSPFFEYYETPLKEVFDRNESMLFQWNKNLLEASCRLLSLAMPEHITLSYEAKVPVTDLRNAYLPRQREKENSPSYLQVFQSAYGFIGNLSLLDLLFNLGKESKEYLLNFPKPAGY